MITPRRLHKFIGLALLLPFLGWILTAFIFYFKPGYDEAYASLQFRTYPLENVVILPVNPDWLEVRSFRTILGIHLCVRTVNGWSQFDPVTLESRPEPADDELKVLLTDAFSSNPDRYGSIASMSKGEVVTTTGVRISLNWQRMSVYQRGSDTDLIDLMYRIHYLQWTGIETVDKILGPLGLLLVLVLGILGIKLALRNSTASP
ncbi:MAG: hypothetical protein WEB33_11825 [Bacteroidota bacterium]